MFYFISEDGTESFSTDGVLPANVSANLPTANVELRQVSAEMCDLLKRALYAHIPCKASKVRGSRHYSFRYDGANVRLIVTDLVAEEMKVIYNGDIKKYR